MSDIFIVKIHFVSLAKVEWVMKKINKFNKLQKGYSFQNIQS